jgi:hypothetical protein
MKTMTCRELGGKCDQKFSDGTWDEMVQAMTKHVMEKDPDVAKDMEQMHAEDPKKCSPLSQASEGACRPQRHKSV